MSDPLDLDAIKEYRRLGFPIAGSEVDRLIAEVESLRAASREGWQPHVQHRLSDDTFSFGGNNRLSRPQALRLATDILEYCRPPVPAAAAVDRSALEALVAEWRAEAEARDKYYFDDWGSGRTHQLKLCIDELAARLKGRD